MGVLRNTKGQLEIVGLAILVAGVTTLASMTMLSMGGGVISRTEFIRNFLFAQNTLEGMEIFYNDMVLISVREVLKTHGHDMSYFCALAVKTDDTFKNSVIEKTEELILHHTAYKGQKLPHMKDSVTGEAGTLNANVIGDLASPESSYLEVSGKPADKIRVNFAGAGLSSEGSFSFQIKTTADAKPDLIVSSVKTKDSGGNEVTSISLGSSINIEAEVKNLGCAKADNVNIKFESGSTNIGEETAIFQIGDVKTITKTWTPPAVGTYVFKVSADSGGSITELKEDNNDLMGEILAVS